MNIAAFIVLTTATIAWSIVNILHLDFIERPDVVTAEFAQSPGLRSGYEVTYLGYSVGRIRGVELVPGMSEVELAIDRNRALPADLIAVAKRRSAIGEPYVDLAPAPGSDPDTGPRLSDGDRISLERTSSPLQYGDLFRSLAMLVKRIDADSLAVVTDELAAAVDGRGDDLRRIVDGAADLTTTLSENGDDIERLIDGVAEMTGIVADNREALGSGIESLAALTEALEVARPSVEALVDEAPSTIGLLNAIIEAADDAIICTVDGTAVLDVLLDDETLESLTDLLQGSAAFADVIRLVQDPRDQIFRLYLSPSGGNPPTVEFAERKPYPDVPGRLTCPEHVVTITPADEVAEAGEDGGGDRPEDGSLDPPRARPDPAPGDLASGTSDDRPDESVIDRLVGGAFDSIPFLLALAGAGLLVFALARRRRQG